MSRVTISEDSSIMLPAIFIQQLGIKPGEELSVETLDGGLLLKPIKCSLQPNEKHSSKNPDNLAAILSAKNLKQKIEHIKGVGPRLAGILAKRNILTVEDALYLLPIRYEDRRTLTPVTALKAGMNAVFSATVLSSDVTTTKGGRKVFEALIGDGTGAITCKWFNTNATWMMRTWKVGRVGLFCGEVTQFGHRLEIHHPDAEWLVDGVDISSFMACNLADFGRILPLYPLTEGLHQKTMRKIMREITALYISDVKNFIPHCFRPPNLPSADAALRDLHSPPDDADIHNFNDGESYAHRGVVFDELFYWELGLAQKKLGLTQEEGIAFKVTHRYTKELIRMLPFELTVAQRRVLAEIKTDMMAPHPMHRLVQGDVGSGKTVVALMAALIAAENGYQTAIMAPTEILAEQHWHTLHRWCEEMGLKAVLVTSALKGNARKAVLAEIADGTAGIVIGTHAVIQEKILFHRLGLGVVDEQHRFGVLQRGILKKKGTNPDILVMTATPIPRTLAMTVYGDLHLSVIDELPPGRLPVETRVFYESQRREMYLLIRKEVLAGGQVYIIYPLVEENESSSLKAATQMAEHLQSDIFPGLGIGLLHGRLNPVEKESVMAAFKRKDFDILVATTVIEVGIDVPNATMMVVEHAERFGLSQLHQLRGRVGRGREKSRCILMTEGKLTEDAEKRLKTMEKSCDGFRIAEADLEIRGPGDFLGTRQAGIPDFRVANILRHADLLDSARGAAGRIVELDPKLALEEHAHLREELLRRWGSRLELAKIG